MKPGFELVFSRPTVGKFGLKGGKSRRSFRSRPEPVEMLAWIAKAFCPRCLSQLEKSTSVSGLGKPELIYYQCSTALFFVLSAGLQLSVLATILLIKCS